MPDPTTTNFGWTLPTTGGDSDSWGGLLNGNWTSADGVLGALLTATGNRITPGGTNVSAAAWTTNGLRAKFAGATYTDTSSSGTVAAVYVDAFKAATIAASGATTYTNAYGAYFENPVAGTNATVTNAWALGADSLKVNGNVSLPSVSVSGTNTSNILGTYQEGAWTPADASGASLSLTVARAVYTRIGRLVIIDLNFTYPSTANNAASAISGLPFGVPSGSLPAGSVNFQGNGFFIGTVIGGIGHLVFVSSTGAILTNAQLSGLNLCVGLAYFVT